MEKSLLEQLAVLMPPQQITALLKLKEDCGVANDDPLWGILLELKLIENATATQSGIVEKLLKEFDTKLDATFATYSNDLVNKFEELRLKTASVEEASLNISQARITSSVSKLVSHAAHEKAVHDWIAMSKLSFYSIFLAVLFFSSGFVYRAYRDYRYSDGSGLSSRDAETLAWANSSEGKFLREFGEWNGNALAKKADRRLCELDAQKLKVTLQIEGRNVDRGWCALWMLPPAKR
jgi:hypothetical protein